MWRSEAKRVRFILYAFQLRRWATFWRSPKPKEVSFVARYGNLWKTFSLTIALFPFKVAKLLTTVCATGGGAFKFEDEFHKVSKENFYEALA